MKKLFVFLFMSFVPMLAFAEEGWKFYLRGDAGITYSSADVLGFDMGGFQEMYNVAFGTKYGNYRLEVDYQARATVSEALTSLFTDTIASLSSDAIFLNAYYEKDLFGSKYFDWYVGAGVGGNKYLAKLEHLDDGTSTTDEGFSASLGAFAGISLDLNRVVFDLGLDYYYTFKPSMNSLVPKLGIRVMF